MAIKLKFHRTLAWGSASYLVVRSLIFQINRPRSRRSVWGMKNIWAPLWLQVTTISHVIYKLQPWFYLPHTEHWAQGLPCGSPSIQSGDSSVFPHLFLICGEVLHRPFLIPSEFTERLLCGMCVLCYGPIQLSDVQDLLNGFECCSGILTQWQGGIILCSQVLVHWISGSAMDTSD